MRLSELARLGVDDLDMNDVISAWFLENLPRSGDHASEIRSGQLGPRVTRQLERMGARFW